MPGVAASNKFAYIVSQSLRLWLLLLNFGSQRATLGRKFNNTYDLREVSSGLRLAIAHNLSIDGIPLPLTAPQTTHLSRHDATLSTWGAYESCNLVVAVHSSNFRGPYCSTFD